MITTTNTGADPDARGAPPVAEVEDLRVSFGDFEAVRGVTFEVRRGECLALVGESGSGSPSRPGRCSG